MYTCQQLEIQFQESDAQVVPMTPVVPAPSLARGRQGVTPSAANVGGESPVSQTECGWCAGCPLAHVCGDECALNDDFMSNPSLSGTIFRNLNEFITFKKRFGWA
jgi:hypothetical protein